MGAPRHHVIQTLLSLHDRPRYLEIGVNKGATFHRIHAHQKIAVDPAFQFSLSEAQDDNPQATYHQVTSDHYFQNLVPPDERFHVIYLDGLHTAEQTLRDFMHAMHYLRKDGVILIDDVRPRSHLSAIPDADRFRAVRKYTKEPDTGWMGDVYKVLYFIDTFVPTFTYRTISDNHGQAVVWPQQRSAPITERQIEEIGRKLFDDLVIERDVLRLAKLEDIVEEVRAWLQ